MLDFTFADGHKVSKSEQTGFYLDFTYVQQWGPVGGGTFILKSGLWWPHVHKRHEANYFLFHKIKYTGHIYNSGSFRKCKNYS